MAILHTWKWLFLALMALTSATPMALNLPPQSQTLYTTPEYSPPPSSLPQTDLPQFSQQHKPPPKRLPPNNLPRPQQPHHPRNLDRNTHLPFRNAPHPPIHPHLPPQHDSENRQQRHFPRSLVGPVRSAESAREHGTGGEGLYEGAREGVWGVEVESG